MFIFAKYIKIDFEFDSITIYARPLVFCDSLKRGKHLSL